MFDKIDKIDKALCYLDWISPLIAWVRDIIEGPSVTLFVPEGVRSGRAIANLLNDFYDIESWGHMTVNNFYMLTIHKYKLDRARWALDREGIPYEVGRT